MLLGATEQQMSFLVAGARWAAVSKHTLSWGLREKSSFFFFTKAV